MPIDKIANPAAAAGAYANTAKAGSGIAAIGEEGQSFRDMLRNTAVGAINTLKHGEKISADAVIGKADLTDVVEAVTAAETTLQTVVAIRDRLVGAYQDIMRMPI